MTIWPKNVKSVAVFSTASPVTVVALVAVKTASLHEMEWPDVEAQGSLSKSVPARTMRANPMIRMRGSLRRFLRRLSGASSDSGAAAGDGLWAAAERSILSA